MATPAPYDAGKILSGTGILGLSFVHQDAAIKVDEEGSEAAAVSSTGVFVTSPGPNPHAVFHANHPFLYLITESSTGAVLFAGRYGGE